MTTTNECYCCVERFVGTPWEDEHGNIHCHYCWNNCIVGESCEKRKT